jgi:hypothetical protein
VPCVQATPTDFVITGSIDGHIKFWKKQETGIEFVKHYRGHLGAVDGEHQEGQLHVHYCFPFETMLHAPNSAAAAYLSCADHLYALLAAAYNLPGSSSSNGAYCWCL